MKSRLIKAFDYKLENYDKNIIINNLEQTMKEEVLRLCKKFSKHEDVNVINAGDVVMLDMESSLPKYNKKNVGVNVGKKFFSEELETQLVGLKVGETATLTVSGEIVKVKINSSKRRVIPELSDEIVEKGMARPEYDEPEIKTIAQYYVGLKRDCLESLTENKLWDLTMGVIDKVIEKSEFDIDYDEVNTFSQEEINYSREELKNEGYDIEKMTPDDYKMNFGMEFSNFQELCSYCKEVTEKSLKIRLLTCNEEGKDSSTLKYDDLTEEYYMTVFNYIKNTTNIQVKED